MTDWMDDAACKGATDLFFPAPGKGGTAEGQYAVARKVCAGCPVREECLEYALENAEGWGMWGGLTRHERKKLPNGRNRRDHAVCGTLGGYTAHRRRGEEPCQMCRDANAAYQRGKKRGPAVWSNYGPCDRCGAAAGLPCRSLGSPGVPAGLERGRPHDGRHSAMRKAG